MRLLVKIVKKYPMEQLKQAVGNAKGVEEERAHISLLTAHKGKGREWGHVALGKDFTLPEKNPLLDTDDNTIGTEEARLQYVALTRAQINLYGCKEMIGTYRERAKINEQLLAVEGEPLETRLAVKMKFAPSVRNEEKFKAFYDNLEADEQSAMSAKISHLFDQKVSREVKSLDQDIVR
jgi:superfamily I DNA/RNA helicase